MILGVNIMGEKVSIASIIRAGGIRCVINQVFTTQFAVLDQDMHLILNRLKTSFLLISFLFLDVNNVQKNSSICSICLVCVAIFKILLRYVLLILDLSSEAATRVVL